MGVGGEHVCVSAGSEHVCVGVGGEHVCGFVWVWVVSMFVGLCGCGW